MHLAFQGSQHALAVGTGSEHAAGSLGQSHVVGMPVNIQILRVELHPDFRPV